VRDKELAAGNFKKELFVAQSLSTRWFFLTGVWYGGVIFSFLWMETRRHMSQQVAVGAFIDWGLAINGWPRSLPHLIRFTGELAEPFDEGEYEEGEDFEEEEDLPPPPPPKGGKAGGGGGGGKRK
jgi:hypothetical protein